jgi:repressor LexA
MSGILRTKVDVAMRKLSNPPAADAAHPQNASLGDLLRARREALKLSLQRVADDVGCTKSYLCEVELGKRAAPGDEAIAKLETALMVPAGTWVRKARWERSLRAGGSVVQADLRAMFASGDANTIIAGLRAVVPHDQSDVTESREEREASDVLTLPARGGVGVDIPIINRVPAGKASEFTDLGYPARTADAFMRCPGVTDPDAFAARVLGDSMEPVYLDGDVVVFSPLAALRDGADCFARLEPNHECTFKRVYFEEGGATIRLQPLNAKYQARVVQREEVAGLYAAVRVLREIGGGQRGM